MSKDKILSSLAFEVLKDADHFFKEHKQFSDEILQSLFSIFGISLTKAFELLDNARFVVYKTKSGSRRIMKIGDNKQHYFVLFDINFCQCDTFRECVLDLKTCLICEHVLAAKFSQIVNEFKTEEVSDSDFKNLLDEQMYILK